MKDGFDTKKECDRQGFCNYCRNGICTSPEESDYDHCFNTERWQQHIAEAKPLFVFPSRRTRSIPMVFEGTTVHYFGAQPFDIDNFLKGGVKHE